MNTQPTIAGYVTEDKKISSTILRVPLSSKEEGEAYIAEFPKSLKLKVVGVSDWRTGVITYHVESRIVFRARKGNDKNEAGIRRFNETISKIKPKLADGCAFNSLEELIAAVNA